MVALVLSLLVVCACKYVEIMPLGYKHICVGAGALMGYLWSSGCLETDCDFSVAIASMLPRLRQQLVRWVSFLGVRHCLFFNRSVGVPFQN